MVLNVSISQDNFDLAMPLSNGCHFIGMKFQNLDNNMKYYQFFNVKIQITQAIILLLKERRY